MKATTLILILTISFASLACCRESAGVLHKSGHRQPTVESHETTVEKPKSDPILLQDDTTTTRKSYGDYLADSFYAAIVGFFLICGSCACIWFNERRAVDQAKVILGAKKRATTQEVDKIDTEKEGELVHIVAEVHNENELVDEEFGIKVTDGAKIIRTVEYYQTIEHQERRERRDQIGGGGTVETTYRYTQEWSSTIHNSSTYHEHRHRNDNDKVKNIASSHTTMAPVLKFGNERELATSQISQLNRSSEVIMNNVSIDQFSSHMQKEINGLGSMNLDTERNIIYIKHDKSHTSIGDVRVTFRYVPCVETTICAQQQKNTFVAYPIEEKMSDERTCFDGCSSGIDSCCMNVCGCCGCCKLVGEVMKADSTVNWVYEENLTFNGLFDRKVSENETTTKLIRWGSILAMGVGIYCLFGPLIQLMSIIQVIGSIVSVLAFIVSVILALLIGWTLILLAWIAHRPILAILMIAVTVGVVCIFTFAGGEEKAPAFL